MSKKNEDSIRLIANAGVREFIDNVLKDKGILGCDNADSSISIFLIGVALGVNSPKPYVGHDAFVKKTNIHEDNEALLAAATLGNFSSDSEIDDSIIDPDNIYKHCSFCASSGFDILKDLLEEVDYDNELFELRMLRELDKLYLSDVAMNMI